MANPSFGLGLPNNPNMLPAIDQQPYSSIAIEPVQSGDLVCFRESGGVSKYEAISGTIQLLEQNNTVGAKTVQAPVAVTPNANYQIDLHRESAALLSNGNTVYVYSGNGTVTTTDVYFRIVNNLGVTVVNQTLVAAGPGFTNAFVSVTKDGFGVWYRPNNNAQLAYAYYSNSGSLIQSSLTLITDHNNSSLSNYSAVSYLSNNTIALAYWQVTTNNAVLRTYTVTGTLLNTVTIEVGVSPFFQNIVQATNGDIVVAYLRSTATVAQRIARFTLGGDIIGNIQIFGGTDTSYGSGYWSKHNVVALANNTVAIVHSDSVTAANPAITFVNSSNSALITIPSTQLTIVGVSQVTGIPSIDTDGNTIIFHQWISATQYYYVALNNNGQIITPVQTITTATLGNAGHNSSNIGYSRVFFLGAAGYVSVIFTFNATNYGFYYIYTSSDRVTSSVTTLIAPAATIRLCNIAIQTRNSNILTFYGNTAAANQNNGPTQAIYYYNRSSIYGIALNSADKGQPVKVATRGSYTIPDNQIPYTSVNFDGRAFTPAGNRGTISGKTATFYGINISA